MNPTQPMIDLPAVAALSADAPPTKQGSIASLDDVIAERKRVEEYTQTQMKRLNRLRELIKEEKSAAEQELTARRQEVAGTADAEPESEQLRQQLAVVQMERDAALMQLLAWKKETTETLWNDFELPETAAQARIAELTAENHRLALETDKLKQDFNAMEQELVAERRRLQEEQRKLAEEARELYRREQALAEHQERASSKPKSSRDLCLLEAELREMKEMLREQVEHGRAELNKERLSLARLREKMRLGAKETL